MTTRSLINLILKILGLFLIRDVLAALSRALSVIVYFPQYASRQEAWYNLGATLPSLVLYTFFVYVLIFKSNALMNILRLDKGIGEQILPIRLHRSVILGIVVIVAGGWLFVSGLPEFIRQAMYYYQERKIYFRMAHPDMSYVLMAFSKIILGLVLIVFNRTIVNIIEMKRKNNRPWYWPVKIPFTRKRKNVV